MLLIQNENFKKKCPDDDYLNNTIRRESSLQLK